MARTLRLAGAYGVAVLLVAALIAAIVGIVRLPALDADLTSTGNRSELSGSPPDPAGPERGTASAFDGRSVAGVTCQRTGAAAFDVVDTAGEDPSAPMTVAVDLVDTSGARHRQVVPLALDSSGNRGAVAIWGPATAGDIDVCVVTAVQIGDRIMYTGW